MEKNAGEKRGYLAKAADIALVLGIGSVAVFVFFRWIAGGLVPFLGAVILTACIRPVAMWMHDHSRGSLRFCGVVTAGVALFALGGLLFWGVGKLLTQMGAFLKYSMESIGQAESWRELLPPKLLEWVERWFVLDGSGRWGTGFGALFPGKLFSEESAEKVADAVWLGVQEGLGALAGWLTGVAGSFMSGLPGLFLGGIIGIVAVFYLAADTGRGNIRRDFFRLLPERFHAVAEKGEAFLQKIFRSAGQYIRAYVALGSITFLVLFTGFSIMGVRYGMVWAFLTALADLLPFIGCGCVLLPWAVWSFLTDAMWRGVGLVVLLVVNWGIRQFLEPRILGKMMGVHPFWMLTAMYLGLRWFGVGGLIVFPVILGILSGNKVDPM